MHFWSENQGCIFISIQTSFRPACCVQLRHYRDFFPWRWSLETESNGLSNFKSVFGAVLGALVSHRTPNPSQDTGRYSAERKSLSRAVTVNVLSILLTKVSLALHPAVKTGQKFRYQREGAGTEDREEQKPRKLLMFINSFLFSPLWIKARGIIMGSVLVSCKTLPSSLLQNSYPLSCSIQKKKAKKFKGRRESKFNLLSRVWYLWVSLIFM